SSEIQDYGADEEWEAFSNPDGQKKKPVVVPEQAGILPTSISMPTPTTLSPEIDAIPIEAMTSSGEDEKATTMTMQKSSPIVIEENLAESLSDVSFGSEEGQVQERTTTIATTTTAAANFNEDFKTAVKEQQEEILRSRKKQQKEKKKGKEASEATEEKEKSEERKGPKKQSHSVDEGKVEDQVENEPSGAGGQIDDGSDELSTAIPDYSVETKRQWKKKQEEDENENVISDEVEEPMEVTTTEPEDSSSDEEETEREIEKKKLEKKRRKKGKRTETEDEIEEGSSTPKAPTPPIRIGGYDANIRTDDIKASLKDAPNAKYYYPPKVMVPLPSCFYNPSGYVCCNLQLNNLIEDTFETVKNVQGYSACNIARMANIIQQKSEEMFGHPFESVVALSDFAQNVHFAGDLVCKVEIDG
ncbi:ground-like domain protein, partial [Ostertagia ostertagi]